MAEAGGTPQQGADGYDSPAEGPTVGVGLQDRHGNLVTSAARLPQLVADYWGEICRSPDQVSAERERVLAALRERNLRIPAEEAEVIGQLVILDHEVWDVLKASPPGKSPGWDGIPTDLYKGLRDVFAPMLAALYTAIGHHGIMPRVSSTGLLLSCTKIGGPGANREATAQSRCCALTIGSWPRSSPTGLGLPWAR
jgi:hypothetical protein